MVNLRIQCFNEKWVEINLTQDEEKYYLGKAKEISNRELENVIVKYDSCNKVNIYNIPNKEYDEFFYKSKFERIRRITGYLSEVKQFNNAKQGELRDRVKHNK